MTDPEFLALVQAKFPRSVHVGKVTGQVRLHGPAWDMLREVVWERDGRRCVHCKVPLIIKKGAWWSVECAHYKSKGSGGNDAPSNVRSLCGRCHDADHHGKEIA